MPVLIALLAAAGLPIAVRRARAAIRVGNMRTTVRVTRTVRVGHPAVAVTGIDRSALACGRSVVAAAIVVRMVPAASDDAVDQHRDDGEGGNAGGVHDSFFRTKRRDAAVFADSRRLVKPRMRRSRFIGSALSASAPDVSRAIRDASRMPIPSAALEFRPISRRSLEFGRTGTSPDECGANPIDVAPASL